MYMNMTILIYMNIYISRDNEEYIREYSTHPGQTMAGLINRLLELHREGYFNDIDHNLNHQAKVIRSTEPIYAPVEPKLITKIPAQDTEAPKLKVMTNDDLKALLGSSGKKPIEAAPTHVCKDTCKHWVWDTDKGGRVNSLTGEFQEGSPW